MPDDTDSHVGSYGNFRNPLGLVFRMLRSGKSEAWSALMREGLKLFAKPIDLALSPLEARRRSAPAATDAKPLILIVGPPRGGTTMIYQILAQALDVTSPNNLSSLFPRSSITAGCWWSTPPSNRGSYFGQTSGLSGVNDGFHIWNQWLGDDRYRTRTDLSESEVLAMQQFFDAWTTAHGKPFLNKNNRNAHSISYLAETLSNVFFVVVRRNPAAVVRSLIRARESVQGDKRIGWGLLCQETHAQADSLGYVRDVCEQVAAIEQQLQRQLEIVAPARYLEITYEDFCRNPNDCLNDLVERISGLQLRTGRETMERESLKESPLRPLSDAEEEIIEEFFCSPT